MGRRERRLALGGMTGWRLAVRIGNLGRSIELLEDIVLLGIVVPSGFRSDGASIPRIFWPVARPFGSSLPAALLHDYLLTETQLSRRECDRLFLASLKATTPYKLKPYILYVAVRIYSIIVRKDKK